MTKPLILISNDDGVTAPGINALAMAMKKIGEVIIVAPDSPQSGMGHAITLNDPIRVEEVSIFDGIKAYQCSGTPADCVKLALDKIVDRTPDLVVSGINHGSNASINVLYSGTMSAAAEGAIDGLQSIGFSLCDFSFDADFTDAAIYAEKIARKLLKNPLPYGTLLNVNFPKLGKGDMKGIKICRQATAKWKEDFIEREDPMKKKYYWMTGKFENMDKGEDTDEWALANGYVSVVPVQFDLTDHQRISTLNQWNLNES